MQKADRDAATRRCRRLADCCLLCHGREQAERTKVDNAAPHPAAVNHDQFMNNMQSKMDEMLVAQIDSQNTIRTLQEQLTSFNHTVNKNKADSKELKRKMHLAHNK